MVANVAFEAIICYEAFIGCSGHFFLSLGVPNFTGNDLNSVYFQLYYFDEVGASSFTGAAYAMEFISVEVLNHTCRCFGS